MFMRRKMKGVPKDHFHSFYRYLYQILLRSGSGEHALHKLFINGLVPYSPIIDSLDGFDSSGIKYSFIYGDRDWMDTDFNGKLTKNFKSHNLSF